LFLNNLVFSRFYKINIFTKQGPPSILQADKGGEFSGSATDHVGRWMLLDDELINAVISKIKQCWPECQLVWKSPRHSESNGEVEQVNQTIQKKLGAWMKENKSTQWSIGCKIAQWCYTTQVHHTLRDSCYHLTFGQHPCVGISNLPIVLEILQNLRMEPRTIMPHRTLWELLLAADAPVVTMIVKTAARPRGSKHRH
jgi:hypothetical protein